MGNKNWQGYDADDKKQADMERGESYEVKERQYRKRDHGFYKHGHPSMHKKVKVFNEK